MARDQDRRLSRQQQREQERELEQERRSKQARGPQQARERQQAQERQQARERQQAQERQQEPDRGREADQPTQLPMAGWRDVAMRVKNQVSEDNVSLIAAGVALYGLLATFPALTAVVSLYGIFASPEQVTEQMEQLTDVMPEQAAEILGGQLESLAETGGGALGVGLVIGFLVALWSARKGMTALMTSCNIAYHEEEQRSFLRQLLVSLGLTLGAIVGFVLIVFLGVATPLILGFLGLGDVLEGVLSGLRWVVMWLLVVAGLAVIYRYAPDREPPQWRWVGWGAAIAATLWVIGSLLFALYVQNFGAYGEMYGALGGVIVLLMWFYVTGFVIVLGAEINAELERQTGRDTTSGESRPIGDRGARSADTVGPSP